MRVYPHGQSDVWQRVIIHSFLKYQWQLLTPHKKLKKKIKEAAKWNKNKVGLKDLLLLDYVKYVYPAHRKSFSPAKAISRMEDQLAKYSDYLKVSRGTKRSFSNLITYNEHDCKGMSHLIDYVFSRLPEATKIEH